MVLNEDSYYSPEANLAYMDCTTYKNIVGMPGVKPCECKALAIAKGEYAMPKSSALMIGSYVDAYFDGTLDKFKIKNPEIFTQKGELRADYKQAEVMIARAIKEPFFMKYMKGETQKILTSEINGVPIRVKIDSLNERRITDLKTTESLGKVYYNSDANEHLTFIDKYDYYAQAAFYCQAVYTNYGKWLPFYLAVITKDKENGVPHPRLAIVQLSEQIIKQKLIEIEQKIRGAWMLLQGEIDPVPCGNCGWCADNLPLEKVISADELMLFAN